MLPSSGLTTTSSCGIDPLVLEMIDQHRRGVEVIDRHIEKTLDLGGVQVERQHAIGAGARDQIGHQLGGDRHPAFVLAILPCIAVVGNDGGDSLGAGPLETVDDHEQFQQTVVDRRTGRLHQKDVAAADILFDLAVDLAIGKVADRDRPDGQPQIAADLSGQFGIRATTENLEIVHVLIVPDKPARRGEK